MGVCYEHCQFPILSEIHRLHISSEKQQAPWLYRSGLKEKIILASITNYYFAINAKKQIEKHKNESSIERGKKMFTSQTFKEYFPQHIIWKVRI